MISKSNSSSSVSKTSKSSSSKTTSAAKSSAAPAASKSQPKPASKPKESAKVSAESKQPESASPVNFGAWGNSLLKQGSSGDGVKALQQSLNDKMGGSLKVDGKFGKDTQAAVRQFQEKNHLKVDGLAGGDTKGALTGNAPAKAPVADPKAAAADPKAAAADPKAGGTKKIGGIEDTSWKDKLPDGLKDHAQEFIDAGKKYNVDPRFLASISMQETGGGKSSAFRNKNNAMGISGTGGPKRFESVGASIDSMARGLAKPDGYYKGKGTISQIGGVYAPVGANNDPNNLNRHWVPNISKNFRTLGGDPSADVK